MLIGLLGFTVTHENMGCQALTCAFLEMLRETLPDIKKHIVVFRNDNTLGNIPDLFPDMSFSLVHTTFHDPKMKMIRDLRKCDIVFDESYGDGFSDIYFSKSVYRDTLIKLVVVYSKKPLVLTPQTYGPFKDKRLEKLAGLAIKKSMKVYARDQISADYANTISNRDVITVTDLAFSLPYSRSLPDSKKKRFGLNVSGLLWKGGFHDTNQFGLKTDYREYCEKLITMMNDKGYEVHLIPHVTFSLDNKAEIPDGDYPFCIELHEKYPFTTLAPNFESPYEAKNYIASMDVFVGARMHSTIGAFSSGVVTIPFAYSRKFKGLFETINYPYIVDGTKMKTDESLQSTIDFISDKDILANAQRESYTNIKEHTELFKNELKKILLQFSNQ